MALGLSLPGRKMGSTPPPLRGAGREKGVPPWVSPNVYTEVIVICRSRQQPRPLGTGRQGGGQPSHAVSTFETCVRTCSVSGCRGQLGPCTEAQPEAFLHLLNSGLRGGLPRRPWRALPALPACPAVPGPSLGLSPCSGGDAHASSVQFPHPGSHGHCCPAP